MWRVALLITVAATLVVAGGPASGSNAPLATASGGASWHIPFADPACNPLGIQLPFSAQLNADGSASGRWLYRNICANGESSYAVGWITCVVVKGNRAWFGGHIRSTNVGVWVGREMWFQVIDNGQAGDVSTLIGTSPVAGAAQDYCNRAPDPLRFWPVENGDIRVRGAT